MGGPLRRIVLQVLLPLAFLFALVVAGFLQEFAADDLPQVARKAGLQLPLADPVVIVRIQPMTLSLYDGDRLLKRYDIGYGRGSLGRVVNRGQATPLGEFRIVAKEKRQDLMSRGSRFLRLNFPSEEVAQRAWEVDAIAETDLDAIIDAQDEGREPPHDTPLGGPLGIQGNLFFFMERRFTDGSIALSNADVNELFEHVGVGTPVIIRER